MNLKRLMTLMRFGRDARDSLRSCLDSSIEKEKEELKRSLFLWNEILLGYKTQSFLINSIANCVRKVGEGQVLEAISKVMELREERKTLEDVGEIEMSKMRVLELRQKEFRRREKMEEIERSLADGSREVGFFEKSQDDLWREKEKQVEVQMEISSEEQKLLEIELQNERKVVDQLLSVISRSLRYKTSPVNPSGPKEPSRSDREEQFDLLTPQGIKEKAILNSRRESQENFEKRKLRFQELEETIWKGKEAVMELVDYLHQEFERAEEDKEENFPQKMSRGKDDLTEIMEVVKRSENGGLFKNPTNDKRIIPLPQVLFSNLFKHLMSIPEISNSRSSSHQISSNISNQSISSLLNLSYYSLSWSSLKKILQVLCSKQRLEVANLNMVLWFSARISTSRTNEILEVGNRKRWRAIWSCYRELRGNELEFEMRRLRKEREEFEIPGGGRNQEQMQEQVEPTNPSNPFFRDPNWSPPDWDQNAEASPMESLLGFKKLPYDLRPDNVTYSTLISIFSFKGDLPKSLDVLKDMIETEMCFDVPLSISLSFPSSTTSTSDYSQGDLAIFKQNSNKVDSILKESGKTYTPNISIYDSFFRGFARISVPSRLVSLNEDVIGESEWKLMVGGEQSQAEELTPREIGQSMNPWRVGSLSTLFEGFLNLKPTAQFSPLDWRDLFLEVLRDEEVERRKSSVVFEEENPASSAERIKEDQEGYLSLHTLASQEGSSPVLTEALTEIERIRMVSKASTSKTEISISQSTQNQESPFQNFSSTLPFSTQSRTTLLWKLKSFSKAPTPQQMFHLLTALRRASGDNAIWVLKQWERVEMKFGRKREAGKWREGVVLEEENAVEEEEGLGSVMEDLEIGEFGKGFGPKEEFDGAVGEEEELAEEQKQFGQRVNFNQGGWHSFKLDNRMKRTLKYLKEKVKVMEEGEEARKWGET